MKKIDLVWLICICIIALALRLYQIDAPISGFHSWPQAQNALIAHQFAEGQTNLFTTSILSSTFSSLTQNPIGNQFTEFPLFNFLNGTLYRLIPIVPAHYWGRIISILSSLMVISSLYVLMKNEYSRVAAIISSLVFAVSPFFILLSRLVLSDMLALALFSLSLITFYMYLEKTKENIIYLIISIISFSLSALIKPTALIFIAPFIYLFLRSYRFDVFKKWQLYAFLVGISLPLILWRIYLVQVFEQLPSVTSLISTVQTAEGAKNIFFSLQFFREVLIERIGIILMGVYMTGFAIFGISNKNKSYLLPALSVSSLLYLFIFQAGNLRYEYFQTFLLPTFAMMIGLGVAFLIKQTETHINAVIAYPLLAIIIALSWLDSYSFVQKMYSVDANQLQIAKLVNSFTESQDKIVTDTKGDPTLLYLSDRDGTAVKIDDVAELRKKGYAYFVTNDTTEAQHLKDQGYKILVENNQFSLIKL
jgi:4-amino-4-deoxy-L-arabinose transferase-like glycosyltransferase